MRMKRLKTSTGLISSFFVINRDLFAVKDRCWLNRLVKYKIYPTIKILG